MDIRLQNASGLPAETLYDQLVQVIDARLAKAGERLVRLTDAQWTGVVESDKSSAAVFRNVAYEATPYA